MSFFENEIKMAEEQDLKRKELQSRFRDILVQKKKENHEIEPKIIETNEIKQMADKIEKLEERLKTEKKKRKELESKFKQKEQKMQEHQKKLKDSDLSEKKIRQLLIEEKERNNKLKNELQIHIKEINDGKTTIGNLKKKLEKQQKKIVTLRNVEQNEEKRVKEMRKVKQKHQELIAEAKVLRLKIQNQPTIDLMYKEKFEKEKEKNVNILHELKHYKKMYDKEKSKGEIQQQIQWLMDNLSIDTIDEYFMNGKNPFTSFIEKMEKMRSIKRKKANVPNKEREYLYGYTIKANNKWHFVDLDYQVLPIQTNQEGYLTSYQLKSELPTKVERLEDGRVCALRQYKMNNHQMKENDIKTKKNKKEKEKQTYVPFGSYCVLIIGARHKGKYVNRLEKHGLEVVWHDAYEENQKRIDDKLKKADIILVCTSHTSHSAINHIPKNDIRVQEIEHDNEEVVVARVRYAIEHLLKSKQ